MKFEGCFTAIITPMKKNSGEINFEELNNLVDFQMENQVNGIVVAGTTGESPTLTWEEYKMLTKTILGRLSQKYLTIVGTGSNCTTKTMDATAFAEDNNADVVLLVDPYYNGPSSMEIRKEYLSPVAEAFPEIQVIPYIIPSRSGTQLLPQDLAILKYQHENIRCVKEATGDLENMKLTRKLCGSDFIILSGDDSLTFEILTSLEIKGSGVISVISNIVPNAVQDLVSYIQDGNISKARLLSTSLKPLFDIVTVKTYEQTSFGEISIKARNPLPCKTLMNILGMISSSCRRPLGKMTRKGLEVILAATRDVLTNAPEILEPIEQHFDVDLNERLYNDKYCEGLYYS